MRSRILVTGSTGLIGTALRRRLDRRGYHTVPLDLRALGPGHGDVREPRDLERACRGCAGIVHLAAVSRVVWGERDPGACWSTNVDGTRTVVAQALAARSSPWLILSSSREVYGRLERLPATESMELAPINTYGRTKVEAEKSVEQARAEGLRGAVLRLSNVYGDVSDHATRVVPAFARAAVHGSTLHVQGRDRCFDFTHLDDTVDALTRAVDLLERGRDLPRPIHLVTGHPTSLGALAQLAVQLAGTHAPIVDAPARSFDVERFHGDPSLARAVLGWEPRITIRRGLGRLVGDYLRAADRDLAAMSQAE